MSKLMIIDSKMNSVVIEADSNTLKLLGIKPDDVVKHKSKRKLLIDLENFIKMQTNV